MEEGIGERRTAIGEAAIAIIAREGLRALTHRAVDRELSLPVGSTSYYVRTRRQLLEAAVNRLAHRTGQDLDAAGPAADAQEGRAPAGDAGGPAGALTPAQAAAAIAAVVDAIASRRDDNLARYALAVDLTTDPDLHPLVTAQAPVRSKMLHAAATLLTACGADGARAPELVALVDGLIYDRLAGSGAHPEARIDAGAVVAAYLTGLPKRSPSQDLP